jgi:membrane associated rhomboid family serine protease
VILPIAHESESARLPWATLALVAALVAAFVAVRAETGFVGGAAEVKLEDALEVWLTHPYLQLDPQLLAEIERGSGEDYSERIADARLEAARAAKDPTGREDQQAELDYVTRLALRGSDAEPGPTHPFLHFGWVPATPRVTALFAHPLLHAGFAHLALAVLLIWLAGPALEGAYGRAIFAGVCLACVLASAFAYSLAATGSRVPLVGAFALAAGVVGAFVVRFADGELKIWRDTWVAPAWAALPVWLAASGVLWLWVGGPRVQTGESLAPNLAGFACGALVALGVRVSRLEERRALRAREARETAQLDPRIRHALDVSARGSHDQAIAIATAVLRERPDDADALAAIWSAHLAAGREAQGVTSARRLIEVYARHGKLAPAARVFGELVRAQPETRLETTVLLRIVPELVVQAHRDAAIAALRAAVSPENRALSVGQAVRAAELAAELDPACALTAARFALERSAELADDKRERLAKLVADLQAKLGGEAIESLPPLAPKAPEPEPAPTQAPIESTPPALAESDSPRLEPFEEGESFELEATSYSPESAPTVPTVLMRPPTPVPAAPPAPTQVISVTPPQRAEPSIVKVTPAVPVELDALGVKLRVDGAAPTLLAWERIEAVGVGLVAGIAPKPIVVIDLALNWADGGDGVLEVLRMRSDSFRARALVGGEGSALEALRALLAQLLARSGAVPLPDGGSARGLPFREFPDPSSYERDVLLQAG